MVREPGGVADILISDGPHSGGKRRLMHLRLLADDLTGALDTTAELVPLTGPVPAFWPAVTPAALEGSAALDSGTREAAAHDAVAEVERLSRHLYGASLAYKKIDSLLRGATLEEIAACMRAGGWRYAVLAPAFPFQRRITRAGRQWTLLQGRWTPTGPDLVSGLGALGVPARVAIRDLRPGINVFDATDDATLQAIADLGRQCAEPVLWIGSGGLAQALAAGRTVSQPRILPRPVLGLFGSDQAATAAQLAACGEHWLELEGNAHPSVTTRLCSAGLALVSFRLAPGLGRETAASQIAARITHLTACIDPPGSVVVAGGETLRSLCDAVRAASLLVTGRLIPGVPCSIIQGGPWNGVTAITKSGAFGSPDLLRCLLLEEGNVP